MESGIFTQKVNSECVRDCELLPRYSKDAAPCFRVTFYVHAKYCTNLYTSCAKLPEFKAKHSVTTHVKLRKGTLESPLLGVLVTEVD